MDKEIKDFTFYPTPAQREFIEGTFTQLVELIPQFSKLQRAYSGLSFTEYSMLYKDLFEFYNIELMTRKSYKLKDILSFRNSFELIYRRINEIATCEHVQIHTFFKWKLEFLNQWLDQITIIAENNQVR